MHKMIRKNEYESVSIAASMSLQRARLAQSVEHETLNLRVVGSSPTLGANNFLLISFQLTSITEKLEQGMSYCGCNLQMENSAW